MTAPRIGLATHIATAEHGMIGLALGEQFCNLQFAQRTQKTEILYFIIQILSHIIPEIALKLDGFAVLVINIRPRNGALIRAVFVRQSDVF